MVEKVYVLQTGDIFFLLWSKKKIHYFHSKFSEGCLLSSSSLLLSRWQSVVSVYVYLWLLSALSLAHKYAINLRFFSLPISSFSLPYYLPSFLISLFFPLFPFPFSLFFPLSFFFFLFPLFLVPAEKKPLKKKPSFVRSRVQAGRGQNGNSTMV